MEWDQQQFGKRLKMLRENIGLTMLAFGKEIGTSASRIKHWEEGKSAPSASWIVKISNKFDVSVDQLLKGDEKKMYATEREDSISPFYEMLAEESVYYDAGHREEIEELVRRIDSLKHRKYAGPEGREGIITEITEHLPNLSAQDLIEIRTLVQLKYTGKSKNAPFII